MGTVTFFTFDFAEQSGATSTFDIKASMMTAAIKFLIFLPFENLLFIMDKVLGLWNRAWKWTHASSRHCIPVKLRLLAHIAHSSMS